MINSLMVFQGIVSVLLILLVLLQFGKGAEAGLMTGAADSVFTASQQGNIFAKITAVLAVLFLGNSLVLANLQSKRSNASIMDTQAPITRPLNTTQEKVDPNKVQTPTDATETAGPTDPVGTAVPAPAENPATK